MGIRDFFRKYVLRQKGDANNNIHEPKSKRTPLLTKSHKFAEVPVSKSEHFDYLAIKLGRIGFVARGFVWSCVGGVALAAAIHLGKTEGTKQSLEIVAANTGGLVVMILATIGIFAYSMWRFFEGFYKLGYNEDDPKLKRIINTYVIPFASGIGYFIFGISNAHTIFTGRSDGDEGKTWEERAVNMTIGKVAFTIAGVLLTLVAFGWIVELAKRRFVEILDHDKLRRDNAKLFCCIEETKRPEILTKFTYSIAVMGMVGRAILFVLLSIFLIRMAYIPSVPEGSFGEALAQLQESKVARAFLGLEGFLIIIFGLYSVFLARYKLYLFYRPDCYIPKTDSTTQV